MNCLISERSLNRALIPILKNKGKNNKDLKFPIKFSNIELSDFWTEKNYLVIDIISTMLIKKYYNDKLHIKIPKNLEEVEKNSFIENIEDLKNIESGDKSSSFYFTDSNLYIEFESMRRYSSNQIYDMFKKTSEIIVSMPYNIRTYKKIKDNEYFPYLTVNIENQNIFDLESEIINTSKTGGRIYERKYVITFRSLLGKLLIYNLTTLNFDWINERIENLSPLSQIFYRIFILDRGLDAKLNISDIQNKLNLKMNTSISNYKILKNILEELIKSSIIKEYNINKNKRVSEVYIKKSQNKYKKFGVKL